MKSPIRTIVASFAVTMVVTIASALPAQAAAASFEGEVLETMDAGGYTYVQIDASEGPVWAAAPSFAVAVGERVRFDGGMPMEGFESKTLGRTFDVVYFISGVERVGAEGATAAPAKTPKPHAIEPGVALPAGHGPLGPGTAGALPAGHPKPKPSASTDLSGIARAEGGRTVGELMDGRQELVGKSVRVRGRVVRATNGVMGKNWLHVQDGSTGTDGSDDLTVTTQGEAAVGDTVVVEGTVALDRSFGHGYDYPVLLEEASVVVE